MKLEEGMFVRTEKKGICKIKTFASSLTDDYIENEKGSMIPTDEIIKASHTLLGNDKEPCLIEPGDYVNGYKVIDFIYCGGGFTDRRKQGVRVDGEIWAFDYDEIKSIVTREQFEAMQYKVEE